jgi:hypothetical protein
MVKVLNVEKLIETQSQKHKERLVSQFSRLLDSTPSFPTYYSIDGVNSSAELGTRDIAQYVGPNSPIKFKKIIGMPIYSLDAITATITYDETLGTYTEYSDDGLVLFSVLKPNPGDHFIINDFNPEVIFAVTDVQIRALRGEEHYAITYSVVPSSRVLNIETQVVETYRTIFRNIGTEDKVLIKVDDYGVLQDYMESYRQIHERYVDENYDKSIGYLKTPEWLNPITASGTCKYLIKFLMDNRTIYFDEILESIFAFEMVLPFESRHNKLYNQSFPLLTFIKRRLPVQGNLYVVYKPLPIALFSDISEDSIEQSIEFKLVPGTPPIYTPEQNEILLYDSDFIGVIQSKVYTTLTPLQLVIAKFMNDEDITTTEFEAVVDDYGVTDHFRFYFMPLVLVILKIKIKSLQTAGNN